MAAVKEFFRNFNEPRPFRHQFEGIEFLLTDRPHKGLFDETGAGKTRQVIEAIQIAYAKGWIDAVVVLAPAAARRVWDTDSIDPCEITKYGWPHLKHLKVRFDARNQEIPRVKFDALTWVVSGYQYLRSEEKWKLLLKELRGRKYWLVCDESLFIKNRKALQSKAAWRIAQGAVRRTVMNGTPQPNDITDFWSQLNIMDPASLFGRNFYSFRARYARMGGWMGKQVVGVQHLEEFQESLKPWLLRRKKDDKGPDGKPILDLPPKTYTTREVALGATAWRVYCQMRDDMVAWLSSPEARTQAGHAAIKTVRLSQITSGFLGGFVGDDEFVEEEVGDEKLRALLEYQEGVDVLLVFCRFRNELTRTVEGLRKLGRNVCSIAGGQTERMRQGAIDFFQGESRPILVAQPMAGGIGLNLQRAHTVAYLSNDYNLATRLQSEDRVHRPGQLNPVTYVDFLATSPLGKNTVDHGVLKTLRRKENVAALTIDQWRKLLTEE